MDETSPCEHHKQNVQDVYCQVCNENKTFLALSFKVAEFIREKLFNEVVDIITWEWDRKKIKSFIDIAFNESLQNAVEHGILEIDYDRKSKALKESPEKFNDFVKDQWVKKTKPVTITLCVNRERILLGFHDQGKGFDYKKYYDKPIAASNLLEPSGRGIPLLMGMSIRLYWNKKGNSTYCAIMSELLQPSLAKENRLLKRNVEEMASCTLVIRSNKTKGKMVDHSLAGAQVRYIGGSLAVNTHVQVASDKLKMDRHAKVVWCKEVDEQHSVIGLKFI
ncbi:MAG: PilZ domain-containing protein [Nitrospinota bacterium]